MATPSNTTKRKKENTQLECTTPGEVELSDPLGNVDPNANWGAEPNFNLNFNLNSPSVSRSITEAFKHQNKQDRNKDGGHPGVKGEETMKTALMSPCEKQKSIVSTSSRSPTAQTTLDSHRPSPVKQVSTLNSKMATSPKPNAVKLTSSTRTTERERIATPLTVPTTKLTEARTKSTNKMTVDLLMQSSKRDCEEKICLEATPSQVLNPPTSPRVHNQEGDPSPISPLTNRTPGRVSNTQKTDPATTRTPTNQKPGQDSRAQGSERPCSGPRGSQNQRTESDPLRTLHMTSVSPKPPSTQRTTTRTRTKNTPGSKVHLHGKDSSIRSGSKTRTKSSSSSTRTPNDSLSSQTSTNSKTQTGSRETLDSKSSLDSKDSSDSKTDWSSKAGPNHKSRMGPRDLGLDSGTTQTKAEKTHKDLETVFDSKSTNEQTLKIHQNTRVSPKPKTSPRVKTSSRLDVGSGSDLTSTSKIAVIRSTSKRNLKPPELNVNFPRSASLSPISRERRKPTGSTARPGLDPKSPSDSFRSGPVQSSSQAALIDSTVAHSLLSVNQSPGSRPGKSLRVPAGPIGEDQRSPGSPPGFLTSLASSSPKTKTMEERAQDPASSVVPKRDPSCSSNITALTRGLTFDSITKTAVRPGNESEKEQLNLTEGHVGAAGGPDVSQRTVTDSAGGDTGRKPGTLLSKLDKLGNANVIPCSRPMGAKEEKKKKQRVGLESTSSGLLPPSTHTSTSKIVKETGTMTEWFERLHPWTGGQKDVGVQVEVGVVECSVSEISSLHQEPPASPLIGSPSCQSSLSCIQPLKHICKINIELSEATDKPSQMTSLPARLRTSSFQQNPTVVSELRQNDDMGVSSESNWEEENGDEKKMQRMKEENDGYKVQTEKPQQVEWDEQGMTWEVYGASVDLDSLGKAIQSHLESKVRDQENHIRSLRKSICSNSSFTGYMKKKKKKKRRRRFLGCCMKRSTVAD